MEQVANTDLTAADLPHPREPFDAVVRFAYTFDGYQALGMELCGEMANRGLSQWVASGVVPDWLRADLTRLRAVLYFEARRWIVLESEPDTRSLLYVHALIEAIDEALPARDAPPR